MEKNMKLLQKFDRREGGYYGRNAIVSYGTSILSNGKYDGWYFKLESPFSITKKYIDANTFEIAEGPCRFSILYTRRVPNENRGSILGLRKGWFPVNV